MSRIQFKAFSGSWHKMYERNRFVEPPLHMSDFLGMGKYAGLYPEFKRALFRDVSKLVNRHKLYSVSIAISQTEFHSELSGSPCLGFCRRINWKAAPNMKYLERFQRCLINPTEDQIFEREPLLVFSFYLSGRVNVLCSFAEEIIQNLDQGFALEQIDGERVDRAESLMWFWLLGAYEVTRTMAQSKQCFSDRLAEDVQGLKKVLAVARMPATKMEKQGRKEAVSSNRSPSEWDLNNRDLLVNDPEESKVSALKLLANFDKVFCSITRADVLAHHGTVRIV